MILETSDNYRMCHRVDYWRKPEKARLQTIQQKRMCPRLLQKGMHPQQAQRGPSVFPCIASAAKQGCLQSLVKSNLDITEFNQADEALTMIKKTKVETKPEDVNTADDTFEPIVSATPINKRVGAMIRKKRIELGLTLQEVSSGGALSESMLSRIENGQSSASLEVLERLCGAFGISLSNLINEIDSAEGSAQLIKAQEQPEVVRTGTKFGHNYKLLSYQRGPNQPFEPFLIEMDRKSEEYPRFQHPGIEFLYILQGSMTYKFGDAEYLLEPGDAFTFSGEVEHGPKKLMTEKIVFISVINHHL